MANRIQIDTTPNPFTAPLEASRDGGLTFAPLVTTTVGTALRGFLENVPAATYAVGSVRVRPVGYPAATVTNPAALTVLAAATGTGFEPAVAGDSLMTRTQLGTNNSPPENADVDLADASFALIRNAAIPGASLNGTSGVNSQLDTLIANKPANLSKWIIYLEGGINDLDAGVAEEEVCTRIKANVAKANAAGCTKIILQTITGYAGNQNTVINDSVNARRSAVNTRLLAAEFRTLAGVVGISNPGQDAFMGTVAIGGSTYFNADGVHYTVPGSQRMGSVFLAPAILRAANGETNYVVNGEAVAAATPPTAAVGDDTANTLTWTNSGSLTAVTEYEYTVNGGTSYAPVTAKPQPVGNIAAAANAVGVRVKATGTRSASTTAFAPQAFTVTATASPIDVTFRRELLLYFQNGPTAAGTDYAGHPASLKGGDPATGTDFVSYGNTVRTPAVTGTFGKVTVEYLSDPYAVAGEGKAQLYLSGNAITDSVSGLAAVYNSNGNAGFKQLMTFTFPAANYATPEFRTLNFSSAYIQSIRLHN